MRNKWQIKQYSSESPKKKKKKNHLLKYSQYHRRHEKGRLPGKKRAGTALQQPYCDPNLIFCVRAMAMGTIASNNDNNYTT